MNGKLISNKHLFIKKFKLLLDFWLQPFLVTIFGCNYNHLKAQNSQYIGLNATVHVHLTALISQGIILQIAQQTLLMRDV
jgi:hypothetical protein